MKHRFITNLIFLPILASASAFSSTVVYTDSQHLPENLPQDVTVVLLDDPERLQTALFGQLSADPDQAARQAQQIMVSPDWQQKQQQLISAYRHLVYARELGVRKVPAVVFDDHDVVYGITDVAQAVILRQQAGGGK